MKLNIGDSKTITVRACDKQGGDIILDVEKGELYKFAVHAGEEWTDWFKTENADGFIPSALFPHPRLKGVNYFCLCGLIAGENDSESMFRIGKDPVDIPMPASGKLYYFANDFKWAYWNNKGALKFEVLRLS